MKTKRFRSRMQAIDTLVSVLDRDNKEMLRACNIEYYFLVIKLIQSK